MGLQFVRNVSPYLINHEGNHLEWSEQNWIESNSKVIWVIVFCFSFHRYTYKAWTKRKPHEFSIWEEFPLRVDYGKIT